MVCMPGLPSANTLPTELPTVMHAQQPRPPSLVHRRSYLPHPPEKPLESLDYEDLDNTVFRSEQASSTPLTSVADSALKWTVCLFVGVVTATAAFTVNLGVENIAGFKFWAALTVMERSGCVEG